MTMIERAAKAMEERRRELIGQPLARIWDELAKAAIEAIREPTDGMLARGDFYESTLCKWEEMIDAALETPK